MIQCILDIYGIYMSRSTKTIYDAQYNKEFVHITRKYTHRLCKNKVKTQINLRNHHSLIGAVSIPRFILKYSLILQAAIEDPDLTARAS